MNTTDTYWDVDGVSLQTYAYNIVTLGDSPDAPPVPRGSDIVVPYLPGSIWVPKVPGPRTLTFAAWVQGSNEDGSIPTDQSSAMKYQANWRMLRRLLFRPNVQFTLTKRFWVPTADLAAAGMSITGLPTQGVYSLISASAKASYAGGLTPSMHGIAHSAFTVDLLLSDPFFYSDEISIPFTTAPHDATHAGPTATPEILGDWLTTHVEVDFTGPLASPKITNNSESVSLWMQYSMNVAQGESATVRATDFSATHYPSGNSYKSSGYVTHDGDKFWMYLSPGPVNLVLSEQSGTGTANLRYKPRWL